MTVGHYGCCATSGCACAHPKEPRRGQVTFGSHVTTTKKKTREKAGHAQNLLPDRASSGVQWTLFTTTTGVTQFPVVHAHTQGNHAGVKFPSHPVAMLLLLRKKRGEKRGMPRSYSRSGPFLDMATSGECLFRSCDFVTSGQKAPTRADMAQLPVAHAHNILPDNARNLRHIWSRDWRHFRLHDFRSLLIAPPQMWLCPCWYTTIVYEGKV